MIENRIERDERREKGKFDRGPAVASVAAALIVLLKSPRGSTGWRAENEQEDDDGDGDGGDDDNRGGGRGAGTRHIWRDYPTWARSSPRLASPSS